MERTVYLMGRWSLRSVSLVCDSDSSQLAVAMFKHTQIMRQTDPLSSSKKVRVAP